jgi:hypothetical protein
MKSDLVQTLTRRALIEADLVGCMVALAGERFYCKRSINPILLFGRWRPKRLGLDVERQQRLDLFEGLGLGQLGE